MKENFKYFFKIIITTIVFILIFDAIAAMLFGSLGMTSESNRWNYVLLLYIFLAILGTSESIYNLKKSESISTIISTILGFSLLGFYYGGSITNDNFYIALSTALVSNILGVFLLKKYHAITLIIIKLIKTIAAYGFAAFTGINAMSLFTVSRFLEAILWGIVGLIYINFTVSNLFGVLTNLKKSTGGRRDIYNN